MKNKVVIIILCIIFIVGLIVASRIVGNESNINENNIQEKNIKEENMSILDVTNSNFEEEVLKSKETVLVDFYADWCGPCQMLSPIVDEVANEREDIKVCRINVDNEQDLAIKYDVMSIPTLVVIKNGQEVNRTVGLVDKNEIIDMIK